MKKLIMQFFKFGIVGGIAFVVDYGIMVFLKEVFGVYYLIASTISFSISTVVNYLLSMRYVFVSRDDIKKRTEFLSFVVLSIIGLGINQLVMYLMTDVIIGDRLKRGYLIAKLVATAIVMIWNFITRKVFLDKKDS